MTRALVLARVYQSCLQDRCCLCVKFIKSPSSLSLRFPRAARKSEITRQAIALLYSRYYIRVQSTRRECGRDILTETFIITMRRIIGCNKSREHVQFSLVNASCTSTFSPRSVAFSSAVLMSRSFTNSHQFIPAPQSGSFSDAHQSAVCGK